MEAPLEAPLSNTHLTPPTCPGSPYKTSAPHRPTPSDQEYQIIHIDTHLLFYYWSADGGHGALVTSDAALVTSDAALVTSDAALVTSEDLEAKRDPEVQAQKIYTLNVLQNRLAAGSGRDALPRGGCSSGARARCTTWPTPVYQFKQDSGQRQVQEHPRPAGLREVVRARPGR
ncbi:unnamed protein product [Boreogadus saida]